MAEKKVLIISYYWPPAGGPGVQRWLKFAKYLPEFGWKPTLFIPENPSYPIVDETLVAEVPQDIDILKHKIWEPYRFAEKLSKSNKKFKGGQFDIGQNQSWKSKLSIWIRGNFFIPDARIFWVKPSVKFLKKHLSENHYDALVTTGPPHSLHLIGLELKKEFPQLKWTADFRDPWTGISYYSHLKLSRKSDAKHRKLEKMVFQNADVTLATSFTDAENFRRQGANAVCITNGFDVDTTLAEHEKDNTNNRFSLSYIGVLEQLRNPEILWQILAELVEEHKEFKENLEIRFAGRIDSVILEQIDKLSLSGFVKNLGYLSHNDSVHEMQNSSLLLITNFPDQKSKGIIPGKIFEYLSTGNPILSFGPEEADVAVILQQAGAGKHFSYSEKNHAKEYILQVFRECQMHGNRKNIGPETDQYSRRNLTRELAGIL